MHGTGRAWFLFLANIIFINYILYYMKSMIKIAKSILPLLGLLLSLSLSAQDIAVKGHVKDHTGEPLIGANILIKGTSVGTISDVDGNFTLKAAVNDILSITCIGFKGQELTVTGSNTPLVITLQEDTEMLDEVVVIGYGQVKKGDVTGSLLTVKPDELNKGKQLTAEDALVGKVAGENIGQWCSGQRRHHPYPYGSFFVSRQRPTDSYRRCACQQRLHQLYQPE